MKNYLKKLISDLIGIIENEKTSILTNLTNLEAMFFYIN